MNPTAILINTCRGPVVDEDALYDAPITDGIRGAGLDVMFEEPPAPEHNLFTLPNIILTPHMAGPSWENWNKALRNSFDNIRARRPRREAGVDHPRAHPRAAGLSPGTSIFRLPGLWQAECGEILAAEDFCGLPTPAWSGLLLYVIIRFITWILT
jgi:D-isomer specific 2-hydroxyacid dehydrogenase, NAD binding domain